MAFLRLFFLIISLGLLFSSPARAGSASTNLAVSASVAATCSVTTTPLAFGNYDPVTVNATSPLNGTGTVSIACTKGATPSITMGNGLNFSTGTRNMILSGGTDLISYALYQPPSTTPGTACSYTSPTAWGSTSGTTFTPTAAPSKASRNYNICGQIPSGQDDSVGSYNDTVIVTVNY